MSWRTILGAALIAAVAAGGYRVWTRESKPAPDRPPPEDRLDPPSPPVLPETDPEPGATPAKRGLPPPPAGAEKLADADVKLRQGEFARLLGEGETALPVLRELAAHPAERLAVAGVIGLTAIGGTTPETRDALTSTLESGPVAARILAARGLMQMGSDGRESLPALERASKSEDAKLRKISNLAHGLIEELVELEARALRGEDPSGSLGDMFADREDMPEEEQPTKWSVSITGHWVLADKVEERVEFAAAELRWFDRLGRLWGPEDDRGRINIELLLEALEPCLVPLEEAARKFHRVVGLYPEDLDDIATVVEWERPEIDLGFAPLYGHRNPALRYYQLDEGRAFAVGASMRFSFKGFMGWKMWDLEFLRSSDAKLETHPDPKFPLTKVDTIGKWSVWR